MRSSKVNYFAVGTFVIAMLAAFAAAVAVLTGRTGATDTYFTGYTDVTGLKFGTQVFYMGFPVGQVERIQPSWDDGRPTFRVELGVSKSLHIPKDSAAKITASGLLAAVSIDIRAGDSKEFLKPGDTIRGLQEVNLFAAVNDTANTVRDLAQNSVKPLLASIAHYVDSVGKTLEQDAAAAMKETRVVTAKLAARAPEMIDNLRDVSGELKAATRQLNRVLSERNVERIDGGLEGFQKTARELADKSPAILAQLQEFSAQMAQTSGKLLAMVGPETKARVDGALDHFAAAASNFARLTQGLDKTRQDLEQLIAMTNAIVTENKEDVRQAVTDLRHSLDTIASHVNAITYNLEATSRNMHEFSRQLRQNPGVLLGGKPPADDATPVRTTK